MARGNKKKIPTKTKKMLWSLASVVIILLLSVGLSYFSKHLLSNQGKTTITTQATTSTKTTNDVNAIKVGFWNILNYDDNPTKDSKKAQQINLAKVISSQNADLMALVEVNAGSDKNPNSVENLTKELNLITANNKEKDYKSITSDAIFGKGNEAAKERVSFIYNANVLDILEINKDKLYGSNPYLIPYDNKSFDSIPAFFSNGQVDSKQKPIFAKNKTTKKIDFARPPVAAKFKIKKTDLENDKSEFVIVASHFDAPGVNSNPAQEGKEEGKVDSKDGYDSTNGSQEISEANHMLEVMNWFENKTNTKNLFFMADTNIKAKSSDKAFENLLKSYKLLIDKSDNTSLGEKFGTYSNSYDKIFENKQAKIEVTNVDKYPLWDVIKDSIISQSDLSATYQKEKSKNKTQTNFDIRDKIRNYVSDHSPVFLDIILSKQ
ncbi:Membrane nuclease, lipoprotein [Mesomycoplasma hyorhinis HUB-1]|uniref:endonuclease/exonuclease/phosphatase family protein n=1 Tax=Mesomycoplasma hyorhinis TaxID=2100 RepID=UPI0001E132CC|nr:Membrane nuclease, lipoprotein [Mesomycoplasma hyorhinis HUB-1]